jgi:hypothetical protein
MFPLIVPAVGTAGTAPPAKVSVTKVNVTRVGVAYDAAGLGDLG